MEIFVRSVRKPTPYTEMVYSSISAVFLMKRSRSFKTTMPTYFVLAYPYHFKRLPEHRAGQSTSSERKDSICVQLNEDL